MSKTAYILEGTWNPHQPTPVPILEDLVSISLLNVCQHFRFDDLVFQPQRTAQKLLIHMIARTLKLCLGACFPVGTASRYDFLRADPTQNLHLFVTKVSRVGRTLLQLVWPVLHEQQHSCGIYLTKGSEHFRIPYLVSISLLIVWQHFTHQDLSSFWSLPTSF